MIENINNENFIISHYDIIVIGFLVFYEFIVRVKPTKKCWSIITGIYRSIERIIPDREHENTGIKTTPKKRSAVKSRTQK